MGGDWCSWLTCEHVLKANGRPKHTPEHLGQMWQRGEALQGKTLSLVFLNTSLLHLHHLPRLYSNVHEFFKVSLRFQRQSGKISALLTGKKPLLKTPGSHLCGFGNLARCESRLTVNTSLTPTKHLCGRFGKVITAVYHDA